MSGMTRRGFLNKSLASVGTLGAAGSAARAAGPWTALAASSSAVLGANEKIRVALIGCGGMGRGDLLTFLKYDDVDCPLICDVDDAQIGEAAKAVEEARGARPEAVKDFRAIMDRKDIDACLVATPDHWHALPTIHACQAGKDVYVEKPLATSIGEGRAMLDAARKHKRVVQMGTQWRSAPHFGEAVEYVKSGKLGRIRQVRCWAYLTWAGDAGNTPDGPPPAGVDYDTWLGPAPERPFNPARFHFKFRWFWDYAGGLMTDWGVHLLNIAMWAMDAKPPRRVACVGGKYKLVDDLSETPDTQIASYAFDDFNLTWEHQARGGHGCEGREHGVMFYGTDEIVIIDVKGWEVASPHKHGCEPEQRHKGGSDGRPEHVRNFLDCMRSRRPTVEDVEIGHRVSTVAHLGNVALRTGKTITWDADRERVVGDDDANRWLTRDYRKPWSLPSA